MSENIMPSENAGIILRKLLNGIKQTPESFAGNHDLDAQSVEEMVAGKIPLSNEVLSAIKNNPPLNIRDLYDPVDRHHFPIVDDTNDGVVIFTADQREKTLRTFQRGPSPDKKEPFYDYADTAMSRTSLFRPEWIAERYVNPGVDPTIPNWAFNHGHFEFQLTYFIGPVNFHWIDNTGNMNVRQMNTGDMNYVTPFVPHTFSTREQGTGLILAVTYGGSVAEEGFQTKIKELGLEDYLKQYGDNLPTIDDVLATDALGGVMTTRYDQASIHETPDKYTARTLLKNVPNQPRTKSTALDVKGSQNDKDLDLVVAADQWGYNTSDSPVVLLWGNHEKTIHPGDSFYMQPGVHHAFRRKNGPAQLAIMQIKPDEGDPLVDLAIIHKYSGNEGLSRVHSETRQWF